METEPQAVSPPPGTRHSRRAHWEKKAAANHRRSQVLFYTFLAVLAASTVLTVIGVNVPEDWRWTEILLAGLGALAALGQLTRRLPLQNVVCIGSIMVLFAGAIGWCGTVSGFPFGGMEFTEKAGPKLSGRLPFWMPLWWVAILVTGRETARLIMYHRRRTHYHGYWIIGLAAVLAVVLDLSWEPFGVRVKEHWTWRATEIMPAWYSAPIVNFLGWVIAVVVTLGFCTPWLVSKRAMRQPALRQPAVLWGAMSLYFVAGNLARGLWLAAGVGLGLTVLVGLVIWHGLNQPMPPHPHERPIEVGEEAS